MAPPKRLAETKRIKGKVEAEKSSCVENNAIEAFVWPQRCGDVASARQRTEVVNSITLKELSSAARLFARHVHGHDAARITGQALEQLNLTSKRQPSTQHAVAITYQLWSTRSSSRADGAAIMPFEACKAAARLTEQMSTARVMKSKQASVRVLEHPDL